MLTQTKHLWAIVDDPTANKGIFVVTETQSPTLAIQVYLASGVNHATDKIRNISYMGEVDVQEEK